MKTIERSSEAFRLDEVVVVDDRDQRCVGRVDRVEQESPNDRFGVHSVRGPDFGAMPIEFDIFEIGLYEDLQRSGG